MRAFMAIELPDAVKARLAGLTKRLQGPGPKVSWVRTENLHLTLVFLGDIQEAQASALASLVTEPYAAMRPFALGVRGLGAFPSLRKPEVIWTGVEGDEAPLAAVHATATRAVDACGIPCDKKQFRPHLTLGRVRDARQGELLCERIDAEQQFEAGDFHVGAVSLFMSELRPSGPRYTRLKEFPFAAV